jgi:hypothetical protein
MVIFGAWTIHGIIELHAWWNSTARATSCRLLECPASEATPAPVSQYILWTTVATAAGTLLSGLAAILNAWINRRDKYLVKGTGTAPDNGKKNRTTILAETASEKVITKFVWSVAVDSSIHDEMRLDAAEKLALLNQDWASQVLAILVDDKSLDVSARIKAADRLVSLNAGKAAESLWDIAVDGGIYEEVRLDAAEKLALLNQDWASQVLAILVDDESLGMDVRMEAVDMLTTLESAVTRTYGVDVQ